MGVYSAFGHGQVLGLFLCLFSFSFIMAVTGTVRGHHVMRMPGSLEVAEGGPSFPTHVPMLNLA